MMKIKRGRKRKGTERRTKEEDDKTKLQQALTNQWRLFQYIIILNKSQQKWLCTIKSSKKREENKLRRTAFTNKRHY